MKALKTIVFLSVLSCAVVTANAQADTATVIQRAVLYADSLDHAFRDGDLAAYVSLSYPGVIGYYGGKQGYEAYVERARKINAGIIAEEKDQVEIVQIANDAAEWQCVMKKRRETIIDGRKAEVISYMVGQSKDAGLHWKYFDVAYNSVESVVYIMPDIFASLAIPQRQIIFDSDPLAKKD